MKKAAGRKQKTIVYLAAAVIGGGLGFLYYHFIGCSAGTCPITSNPYLSAIYGSVLGVLVANIF